jgi:hypothetical protein
MMDQLLFVLRVQNCQYSLPAMKIFVALSAFKPLSKQIIFYFNWTTPIMPLTYSSYLIKKCHVFIEPASLSLYQQKYTISSSHKPVVSSV